VHKAYRVRRPVSACAATEPILQIAGRVFRYRGHSGAGKSTLLRPDQPVLEEPSGGSNRYATVKTLPSWNAKACARFRRQVG